MTTLQNALIEKLQVILYTERRIAEALPDLSSASCNPELGAALQAQQEDVSRQTTRLYDILSSLGESAAPRPCDCVDQLIGKSMAVLEGHSAGELRDSLIIAASQSILYHEMASYGTARMWALLLGHDIVADLLEQTLNEEEIIDETMYELAHARMLMESAALAVAA